MGKLNDNSGPLYTNMMITGMKENYTLNEPIVFSVMVHGYGSGCGDTKAILTKENDSQYKSQVWGVGRQCTSFTNPTKFEFDGLSANTTIIQAGDYIITASFDDSVTYHHTITEVKFSVTGPKITHYYDGSAVKPKVELYDHYYNGIDKGNATVSINDKTYYQTTLDYTDYDLKKGTSIQFQNVTFEFPEGVMTTPGGAFIMLDMKFPDGSEEIYGENKKNPDGSGALGGIEIPTQYGPHLATNSTTVLGNHVMPQAGMTVYNDKIKLLVSKAP